MKEVKTGLGRVVVVLGAVVIVVDEVVEVEEVEVVVTAVVSVVVAGSTAAHPITRRETMITFLTIGPFHGSRGRCEFESV
jgi:hypothetical protein